MPSSAWRSDVCSSDRSEEHTSELQSQSNLVCRIIRAEENTSELQSQSNLVCRLLLEKKKIEHQVGVWDKEGTGQSEAREEPRRRDVEAETGEHAAGTS